MNRNQKVLIFLSAVGIVLIAAGSASAFSLGSWIPWGRRTVPTEQPVRQTESVVPVGGGVGVGPPACQNPLVCLGDDDCCSGFKCNLINGGGVCFQPCDANSCPQGKQCNATTGQCEDMAREGCANGSDCPPGQMCSNWECTPSIFRVISAQIVNNHIVIEFDRPVNRPVSWAVWNSQIDLWKNGKVMPLYFAQDSFTQNIHVTPSDPTDFSVASTYLLEVYGFRDAQEHGNAFVQAQDGTFLPETFSKEFRICHAAGEHCDVDQNCCSGHCQETFNGTRIVGLCQ
jgi:hypothetical protein